MLVAGRVGDIWGHKRLFLVGWLWSAVWSLLAGISVYSRSMVFFVICRAFQGIGAAILVPIGLAIIGSVYKEGHRKNLAFSLYAAGSPVGFTIGAVFSALLAQLVYWPWAYYITAIICCILGALAYLTVPALSTNISDVPANRYSTAQSFDWLGSLTGVSGLIFFNVAWNRAPAVGWQSAQTIAPLVIGLGLFMAFLFVEKRARQPIVPIDRISRDAAWVLLITGLGWSSFGVLVYYVVNFLSLIQNDTILNISAQFSPVPPAGFAASILASLLLKKGLRTSWVLAIALVWFCVANTLLATTPVNQTYWKQVFWVMMLGPFGMDMSFPAATIMISNLVLKEHQGIAASLVATVVYYSQSIGLGIAGTVEVYVNNGDVLRGIRGALYSGIGLSLLGVVVSFAYAAHGSNQLRNILVRRKLRHSGFPNSGHAQPKHNEEQPEKQS